MENYKAPTLTQAQQEWLDEQLNFDKGKIVFTCFYGSHLYGISRPESDVDVKVVYLPSAYQLCIGDSKKNYNRKNEELDIEVEFISFTSLLNSAKKADTNTIDILHCSEEMIIFESDFWKGIKSFRKDLYAKDMKGLVGYIKTHSHKYNNKIDRMDEMSWLMERAREVSPTDTINTFSEKFKEDIDKKKYIKVVTLVKDHEQQYLEVCGKKYIFTWDVSQLSKAMENEVARYGKRTKSGSDKGMDTKSLSHAIRVLYQMKTILEDKGLKFPIKEAPYIKKVKLGEVEVEEVMNRIDTLYDECMQLLSECTFRDEPMIDNMVGRYYIELFGQEK